MEDLRDAEVDGEVTYPRVVRTYDINDREQLRYTEVAPEIVVRGLYALRDIKEGELIEECPAIPIYVGEPGNPKYGTPMNLVSHYAFDWEVFDDVTGELVVSTALPVGYVVMGNHSDDPNIRAQVAPGDGYDHDYTRFILLVTAKRDIKQGEELCYNYGWKDDAASRFKPVDKFMRTIGEEPGSGGRKLRKQGLGKAS